jgi:cytochrome c peroxidase
MKTIRFALTLLLGLLVLAACEGPITSSEVTEGPIDAQLRQSIARWGVIPIGPMPPGDTALVELGRALFFDRILSGNRDIACATCHDPENALGDGLPLSVGTGGTGLGPARTPGPGREFVHRGAPTLLNAGLGSFYLFWDGRLAGGPHGFRSDVGPALPPGLPNTLVAQALLPVVNRREMLGEPGDLDVFGNPNELARYGPGREPEVWDAIMRRLLDIPEYVTMFEAAFPGKPTSLFRFEDAARALAAFQTHAFTRTRSPFDRYLDRDNAALTPEQKRGAMLFFGDAQCGSCHGGPFLGGQSFANVGVPQIGPGSTRQPPLDLGRAEVEENDFYRFAFRVAPLRNVELTSPYMHNGAYSTLEAVVHHYDDVRTALTSYDVDEHAPTLAGLAHTDETTVSAVLATLDGRLHTPLDLTDEEERQLVAFLKSLTDPAARDLGAITPERVPSGLPVR